MHGYGNIKASGKRIEDRQLMSCTNLGLFQSAAELRPRHRAKSEYDNAITCCPSVRQPVCLNSLSEALLTR